MALKARLEHSRHAVLLQENPMQSDKRLSIQYDNGFEYGVKHLLSPKSGQLDEILSSHLEWPRTQVWELLKLGSVYVEGKRQKNTCEVAEGTYIRIHTKPRRFPANDYDWQERILFNNENFLVIHKPPALPVHPSVDNCLENLQAYLAAHLGGEIYITHRLDVPTSGLLVLAKNKEFLALFNHLLAQRQVKKIYRARAHGLLLSEGLYTHYMEPSPRAPKVVRLQAESPQWLECQLRVFDVQNLSASHEQEVRVELLTGRTHQIRAQLAALGAPICGDLQYGAPKKYDIEKIDLEAESLEFLDFKFTTKHS